MDYNAELEIIVAAWYTFLVEYYVVLNAQQWALNHSVRKILSTISDIVPRTIY